VDVRVSDAKTRVVPYRPRWLNADIGWPAFLGLLVAMTALVLAGASLGGWGGVAVILVTLIAVVGLLFVWSAARPRSSDEVREGASGGVAGDEDEQSGEGDGQLDSIDAGRHPIAHE
jgi:hypothetical protein